MNAAAAKSTTTTTGRVLEDLTNKPAADLDPASVPAPSRNVQSQLTTSIDNILKNAQEDGATEARMVVAMFKAEVTFTEGVLFKILAKAGREKTALIEEFLCEYSSEYDKMLAYLEEWKAKEPAERKADVKAPFQIDANTRAMKAARNMFLRAVESCYGLRADQRITSVALHEGGRGVMIKSTETDEFGDEKKIRLTGRELNLRGKQHFAKIINKKLPSLKPGANVKAADPAKVRRETWQQSTAYFNGLKNTSDLSEEDQDILDNMLASLMRVRLVQDGKVLREELNEFFQDHNIEAKVA